jgi:RNA polymerase sigma-70 factor (ECF subfamily)
MSRDPGASLPWQREGREPARVVIEALYAECAERLYRFAYVRTRDAALAEDVVSETFLRAVRMAERLPSVPAAQAAWLYKTAANLIIDDYRRRKRFDQGARELFELEPAGEDIRERADLWAAVDRLPESQRTAVTLRYVQGMKVIDVAGAIGKSEGATKQLLLRALRTLRLKVNE